MISIKEAFCLNEKIENVSGDRSFFWVAGSWGNEFEPGQEVPKFGGVRDFEEIEDEIEAVREEEYPDRPSRIGNVFVFPNVHSAATWAKVRTGNDVRHVYQVEVTGKVFYTNLEYFTEIAMSVRTHPDDKKRRWDWIDAYWEGTGVSKKDRHSTTEAIVDGTVKIVKKIDPGKMSTLYAKKYSSTADSDDDYD